MLPAPSFHEAPQAEAWAGPRPLGAALFQHQPVHDPCPPDSGQGGETEAAQDLRGRQHSRDCPAQLSLPCGNRPRERSELLSPHDDVTMLLLTVINNGTVKIY